MTSYIAFNERKVFISATITEAGRYFIATLKSGLRGEVTIENGIPLVGGKRFPAGLSERIVARLEQWPVANDINEVEYYRPATEDERKHITDEHVFMMFPIADCCFKGTRIAKQWLIGADGFRYFKN